MKQISLEINKMSGPGPLNNYDFWLAVTSRTRLNQHIAEGDP
jgi:hypothetical protein